MPPIDWNGSEKPKPNSPAANSQSDIDSRTSLFTPREPKRKLSDLVLSQVTRQQIEIALARIEYHDLLYNRWNLASVHPVGRRVALNMYGPPGTGKTFCAEAIAEHLGLPIITVDYAQIESKFVGDTPKNITAAFQAAREYHAVLFFDEADSMLSHRATDIQQAADYGVNVTRSTLFMQLDAFEGVVLFATNLASNYDPAFVRRILAHVAFTLPDAPARESLWRLHLPHELPLGADVDIIQLAAWSDGLSGGDILNAVILAASEAARQPKGLQVVTTAMFERAITQTLQSKADVGRKRPSLNWVVEEDSSST